MAQASIADPSRERAVSSEPCSTRPNPFDDDDVLARKRRRTSLASASRSRSVETLNSSPSSPVAAKSAPEPRSDSAMKIDPEPAIPTTPERQHIEPEPASGPRSSRVTINVRTPLRTPSRTLEAIVSSPPSPSVKSVTPPASSPTEAVRISVEESEAAMSLKNVAMDTPLSSTPDSGSPPLEVVTDDEADVDAPFTILDGPGRTRVRDPSAAVPFHDATETYLDTVIRLTQYFTTHDQVSRHFADWIENYLVYLKSVPPRAAAESYYTHREIWQHVPELVLSMVNRRIPYPRLRDLRQEIFTFYRSFAKLTAFFVELDLRALRNAALPEQGHLPNLASPPYAQALGALVRRDEVNWHSSQPNNGDDDWSYAAEVAEILEIFQNCTTVQGGSLACIKQLALIERELIPQFPRLTDHLGSLCVLASNIVQQSFRRAHSHSQHIAEVARQNIIRGYALFKPMSATVSDIVDRNLNHLSLDSATNLLSSLTEIYQTCLATNGVVPSDIIEDHRRAHPPIAPHHVPEAMAYHWKFTKFAKLIRSGQMQLRVMAVTTMCADLVNVYRKCNESLGEEPTIAFLSYLADFLLEAGLVNYILGPTCHPEITLESGNIVGFLVVSGTYSKEHTDAMWQTVTSTQDPRVSDALIRMVSRITNLFPKEALMYFCEKLNTVPVEVFGLTMREFCDQVFKQLLAKNGDSLLTDSAPFDLCIRLIRQSSSFGSEFPVAYPDVQQFAIQKLDSILSHGLDEEGRWKIYSVCLSDIAQRSPSTIGSLWVLKVVTRYNSRDLHGLASEHGLVRLLVGELEAAIPAARAAGFPAVISGPQNAPRKDLLLSLIFQESSSITKSLGLKLWDLLVGPKAACQEDRDVAWQLLNTIMKRSQGGNSFTSTCFSEYLPALNPELFCQGALDFVREGVLPVVNDPTSIVLDDDDSANHPGIELLWRMILTAPNGSIEQRAIQTLVRDIYIESRSIQSFPHYRARKVHLALVSRCLRQLSSAAAKLKAFADGTTSGDDDSMVIVATDQQVQEQELLFIRSLAVLSEFHKLHQAKPEFSAPDMRSLILESPKGVEGESAELKYQSFDGDTQTTVMPLNIGKRNTAASLLASLREVTGFESYQIYYRGRPFVPREREICRSLEDLKIHNGIILVKREPQAPISPRVRLGASPVEIEILSRFQELWEFLSMEEKLAREIYSFLVKLPADEGVLESIDSPSLSYLETFPLGQPFKSLYAVHALHEYLDSQRRTSTISVVDKQDDEADWWPSQRAASLVRAMSLVVPAVSDPQVAAQCPSHELQIELASALVELLVSLLKDPELPASTAQLLDAPLLDRLLAILSVALSADTVESATKHVPLCLQSIFESCSMSDVFMSAFCTHPEVPGLLGDLLLKEPRVAVRQSIALLIEQKCCPVKDGESRSDSCPTTSKFREFLWPLISRLVGPAIASPSNSAEVLSLCLVMFQTLRDDQPGILNLRDLANDWLELLLGHTTSEDPTKPDNVDFVASSLIRLLHSLICGSSRTVRREILPPSGVARKLFWKHLFPDPDDKARELEPSEPIVFPETRGLLLEIIFSLVEDDPTQFMWLLEDLDRLVPVYPNSEGDFYDYELPQQFERAKAIRAPCGYLGLRNLSNTCYFNSLFAQLFMNVDFRQFMLTATVQDPDHAQGLLFQTQKLFAFMQNSIRRFANPEECVASIKTYDDTQIDIALQMDVDEFYNLLFDRWEGQFLTSDEKNRFRSFYGGQLVQQVRSQECEHISERLEPFSAIQCDIKGKSSLQESLQAYVDGEIMEGDNKYKCSTCDRHVDAVKRACLKDIPDNLIFHLKRFDFNLRTLHRSKINDYFAFPTKIDMRPYTIDHLSNPAKDKSEDIFELVGILVHSGTADSGHYYSYVRERPTANETQTWVEFNDDIVNSWDPALMASSCFGGPDYQPHFQPSNPVYDKQYSAYMLFYERSSSLVKNQALSQKSGCSIPLRVEIPAGMQEYIQAENTWILRRHCLYDPSQIQLVCLALFQLKSFNPNGCSRNHAMETQALSMALSHLDQVASRTKDVPDFCNLLNRIRTMCQACVRCSFAVYGYFTQYPETFRMMVQRNTDADVRQGVASLLIRLLQVIKAQVPVQYGVPPQDGDEEEEVDEFDPQACVIAGVIRLFDQFWQHFQINLRSWPEVFDLMLSFVKLGRHELAAFLSQPFFLKWLLSIVWADANSEPMLTPQFAKMLAMVSRRPAARPPSYETIIALLDFLLGNIRLTYTEAGSIKGAANARERVKLQTDLDQPFEITRSEAEILHMFCRTAPVNIFFDRLISIGQNPAATYSVIGNLITQSQQLEDGVYRTLRHGISGQITQYNVTPYLRVAGAVFCRVASQAQLINDLIRHVSQQCVSLQNSEGKAFLDFLRETFDGPRERSGETAHAIVMSSLDHVPDWAPSILGYFDPAVCEEAEVFLQKKIFQHRAFRLPGGEDSEQVAELAEKIKSTARALGTRCLWYLRDNYVVRNVEVTERLVSGLQRVIKQCSKYFDDDDEGQSFVQLSQGVFESLTRLMVVDELEEDGSDWENSSVCSGQLDNFGELATGEQQGDM
ncbi:USP domain-containing protein [Madurella fahalii]|uniref:USP domain-containing protein n=1 Tax=Madurella fahalii TaxID=1157608 RepID=A0ABQ0GRY5_9PEZI